MPGFISGEKSHPDRTGTGINFAIQIYPDIFCDYKYRRKINIDKIYIFFYYLSSYFIIIHKFYIMKSLLFLSLAAFAVSNGNDGSFYQNPGTYFLFSGIGFAIGAVLGFFFARMPNFDYEEVKVSLKTLLPCMLIWGIIIAGIGAMAAYLHIMHCISLQ